MLAHVPSFGRNPRGSPDFLAYPVPKTCMHDLGTGVPRRLGVARSAWSPKAAQALGCSLTPGLRISFGRVTCMARGASGPGLWTPGFLLLCGALFGSQLWLGSGFGCAPPLLAGVMGCVCVFACVLRLYPATPGWDVRYGCVCLGSGFGCAPPLLAGVLGPVCVCVCAPLVPRHSWLGCAVWVCVLGLGFRLRPATPGWAVGACVCLCACSACTPPLLAGVCGVGVCSWALVSAAPRHSWPGCWGVCVLVCALPLYPATPGWGVRCGCVCLGSGFGCAPPLLAGVLGCVCACVRAALVPRHSWLGCAVWVCVLGLGFRLRPVTPGWGVGVCVCLCAHSACTMPLVARLCGVGACAGARVLAAPRHCWLGCWGVCVLVCVLRLYPATPGWGVRLGCLCLGSGFGCDPQLLAGVLGCVCAWCVLHLCPATPGWGVRCGRVCLGSGCGCSPPFLAWVLGRACLCARSACTPPLLAGVCGVGVCAWAQVSAAPRQSWPECWGVCVLVCALRLYPATPGWGVRCGCVCLNSISAAPRHSWPGCWGVCVLVCAPRVPRRSWLGCAVWVCVVGLGSRLRPATPGRGVGVCVCLCGRCACTPPLLAGVCGVGVCAWARVSAAPRHSWLGYPGVCVFVCALRLYHATRGSVVPCGCVFWGSGFGCAPPLLAWVLGCVCACVRAPLVPRHSWLGCAAWVFVLGLGFRLRPAIPGWGIGVCVCLLRAPLVPRHSWLGCAVWACVFALGLWLFPAFPGLGVGVCLFVCKLRLYPATPGWGVRCGCVRLGSGFGCAPPLLAGVLGCVCVCVRAPLVPRPSWLGCAAWVRVLGLGFRLRPATPGWGVGVCVCFCGRSSCVPPLLAGVCGVGVRAWARVWAAPRHSWLGCWGVFVLGACSAWAPTLLAGVCDVGVCVWARVVAAPRLSSLGCWGVRVCVRAPLVLHA